MRTTHVPSLAIDVGVALRRAMGSGLLLCGSAIVLTLSWPSGARPRRRPR